LALIQVFAEELEQDLKIVSKLPHLVTGASFENAFADLPEPSPFTAQRCLIQAMKSAS